MGPNPGRSQSARTEPGKPQPPKECATSADQAQPQPTGDIPIEQSIHPDGSGTAQTGPPPPPE